MTIARAPSLNGSPTFARALADIVRAHLRACDANAIVLQCAVLQRELVVSSCSGRWYRWLLASASCSTMRINPRS